VVVQRISAQQAATEIKAHMDKEGSGYWNWYAGITGDPRTRLFTEHGVRESIDWYMWQCLQTADDARAVEDYLITTLGTSGGPGGGDDQSRCVYAYRKQWHTTP
jgi:hypothetical protein